MRLIDPDEHEAWLYAQQQVTEGGPRFEVILRCDLGDLEGEMVLAEFACPPGTGIEDVLPSVDRGDAHHRAVLRMLGTTARDGIDDYLADVAE